ncbi:MAG: BMP family lipoprotein [Peptostreptococcaceae bacterium]
MKLKKMIALSASVVMCASLITGCSSKNKTEVENVKSDLSVGIVLGEGSINDQSFNQSTWEGLQKAKEEFGIEVKYLESKQESEYIQNIETLVDEDIDLIIGVGYQLKDAIEKSAEHYPEINFAILDETYENIPENVVPVVFNEQEAAYLTGIIAAKMTKTNNVGFIGGLPAPGVLKYQYGYKYGVETTNKDVKIHEQYANSFTDQAKGKAIAKQMYASNVDVILAAAGDSGTGSIEAAKENNKYAIGVDRDQSDLAPENVITSALKKMNVASYDLAKMLVEGNFKGGAEKVYGLKEGAVGIPENTNKLVPQDIIDYVNQQAEKVVNGEIKIPKNEEEYKSIVK